MRTLSEDLITTKLELVGSTSSDFEESAPIIGVTDQSSMTRTRAIVGTMPAIRTDLGRGIRVSVRFIKHGRTGNVYKLNSKDGSEMVFAEVTVVDKAQVTVRRRVMQSKFLPRFKYMGRGGKKRFYWGPSSHLRTNKYGELSPVHYKSGRMSLAPGKPRVRYDDDLGLELFNGDRVYFEPRSYEKVKTSSWNALLTDDLFGEGPDALYQVASKDGALRGARYIVFDSIKDELGRNIAPFRVHLYKKENGYEASGYVRDDLKVTCSNCGKEAYSTDFADDLSFKCSKCGTVDRYPDPVKALAHTIMHLVEKAAYEIANALPARRECSASCSNCEFASLVSYTQNADDPHADCRLGLRDGMTWSQHPEEDYPDLVFMPSGMAYLPHSELPDTTVGLDGDFHVPSFDEDARPVTDGPQMILTRKGWVTKEDHERQEFTPRQKAMMHNSTGTSAGYEIPSWLTADRLNVMYKAFDKSLKHDLFAGLMRSLADKEKAANALRNKAGMHEEFMAAMSDFRATKALLAAEMDGIYGIDEHDEPIYLSPADLAMELEDFETEVSVPMGLARFSADDGRQIAYVEPERDTVPDLEALLPLLLKTHPLFFDLVTEVGITPDVHALFPTVVRDMQAFILAEPNTRMIRVGTFAQIMESEFDREPCMAFRFKDTGSKARGLASFVARDDMRSVSQEAIDAITDVEFC